MAARPLKCPEIAQTSAKPVSLSFHAVLRSCNKNALHFVTFCHKSRLSSDSYVEKKQQRQNLTQTQVVVGREGEVLSQPSLGWNGVMH